MTVLETNQHSEIFIARESLTKPDDVLEQMLLEEVGEDNPFMKLPAHELRLGFLPAMSDITGKGDKKVQKEINELPDTDPVKSWAGTYINSGLRPSMALAQAQERVKIDGLGEVAKNAALAALQQGYLPSAALERGRYAERTTVEQVSPAMLAQKVKEYGWNFDAKSKKYYAPEDVRYTVDANEEKRNPADIMRELTAVNRVYTLAQEYENNSSLRGMIDALRQGLPLTGNETDLRNATDEKKTQELMFYANAIDQVSGFQAENIQYMSDELAALDTIYALPQGPHREAAIQGLGKYKYTPANALQHAIDQTLYDNLSPQFVKSHEKQFKAKNPQGEQEIIASVKTSLVE